MTALARALPVGLSLLAVLTACSGSSSTPAAQPTASPTSIATGAGPTPTPPPILAGGGGNPPTAAPTASPTASASVTPTAPPTGIFGGSTKSIALTPAGGSGSLAVYRAITATAKFGANNGPAAFTFVVTDATGQNDINGPFIRLNGQGAVAIYLDVNNTNVAPGPASSTPPVDFSATPDLQIDEGGGYGGPTCRLYTLTGGTWVWNGVQAGVTGTVVHLPAKSVAPSTVTFVSGHTYLGVACQ